MNNKTILVAVLLMVLIVGVYLFYGGKGTTGMAYKIDPLNASYIIENQPIQLAGGILSVEAAPGSASQMTTRIFGQPAAGDLNGDGKTDAAVILEQNAGGSGTFYYVAAAINTGNATQGTNAILIGDRIAPQTLEISGGKIIFNYADRLLGEPMTTQPSVGVSKYFTVQNGTLTESQ